MSGGVENTPKLRFPGFEAEWGNTTVQELVDKGIIAKPMDGNHGNIHPVASDFVESGIPFIMANDLREGTIRFESARKIRKHQADKLQKGFAKSGDILLTHKATLGEMAVVPEIPWDYIMLTPQVTYYRILVPEKYDAAFLYQYFATNRFQTELENKAGGATRLYIGITEQRKIRLPLCLVTEQQKIAAFLGAVDAQIGQLTREKALLEDYKKGCMQQLFTQKLRFKDSRGNDFPDWEEKQLGDVCEINPRSSALPEVFLYIDLESVSQGQLAAAKLVEKRDAPSRAQRLLEPHDVLFQLVRPYQKNNYFFDRPEIHVASTGYAQLRASENPVFLFQLVHEQGFVNRVLERCTGTNYPAINSNDLAKVDIRMPHPDEQQKIADFLTAIDAKISLVTDELNGTQDFKKGLLQQMFV